MSSKDELLAELKRMRGRRGMTLSGLDGCPALLDADEPTVALERIRSTLELGVRQTREVLALSYALGFKGSGATLKARREEFVSTLDEWKSPDTVEAWEDIAIGELASALSSSEVDSGIPLWLGGIVENGRLRWCRASITRDNYTQLQVNSDYSSNMLVMQPIRDFIKSGRIARLFLGLDFYESPPEKVWTSATSLMSELSRGVSQVEDVEVIRHFDYWSAQAIFESPSPSMHHALLWRMPMPDPYY